MPESQSHKRAKGKAAKKEVPIKGGRRLDALRGNSAIEVERGGTSTSINKALSRLATQKNKGKILRVPQKDMDTAVELAKKRVFASPLPIFLKRKEKRLKNSL